MATPVPSGPRTARLWAEPERYAKDYWEKVPGKTVYFTGDATSIDEDGYVWFSGRADEIIKIADHRIGSAVIFPAAMGCLDGCRRLSCKLFHEEGE